MSRRSRLTRRNLLKGATAAACAGPLVVAAETFGANDRIHLAGIGLGGRGRYVFGSLARHSDVQPVAVCDVMGRRRKPFKAKGLAVYCDYREMLARGDIDAVTVATPTQWKPLHTVAAAKAGADVYCEKPSSLTIGNGRAMVRAVRRYGRIFQHGTQQRSAGEFRFACEMVRSGRVGRLKHVEVYVGGPPHPCNLPGEPCPPDIDWNLWLGPAPWRPFNHRICLQGWEGYRAFSGGGMTGWGSHHFDIAQWGLAADDTGPVEILPPGTDGRPGVTFRYTCGTAVHHMNRMGDWAVVFVGEEGQVAVNRGKLRTWPASLAREKTRADEVHLYRSDNHGGNFLWAIRHRRPAAADVETAHRTMSVCHLGNIAFDLRRPLKWDPAAERFPGDAQANRLLDRPMRSPWVL
ncbi:MAG: Gfo/Idh/MocA family oxidoreductase [Phycisphaerae bacterium]